MTITKQKISRILRKTHLLQVAEKIMFLGDFLKNWKSNRIFLANHADFIPPPAHLAYDAYNHTNLELYLAMGLDHSRLISHLINKYVFEKKINVGEWGCGPARIIRHLTKIESFEAVELFGFDYNEETIKWCKENITNIHFFKCNLEPPLPTKAEMFDCIYALSVFTHISEKMNYAWINELFKALKPNGVLIFTTHGDRYLNKLMQDERVIYESGLLVVRGQSKEGKKHFTTFHPPQYIKNNLLKDYYVLEHISESIKYQLLQDVWVVKKS